MAKKLLRNSLGEIIRTPGGGLMYDEDGSSCCCPLYCDDCCTGTFSTSEGYEITISGVTNDVEGCDCEDLNDTFCVIRDDFSTDGCGGVGTVICGFQISWFIEPGTGGKCTLVVLITDSSASVPTGHSARGELEFDAGDPCRDVSGAMTVTITPPGSIPPYVTATPCELDAVQITVNGRCPE